ncbi:hypothetical protein FRB95_005061 [Tulasnella sp. JGI-2019a]|nr:hypothetical protein FRB95_005061 [Tulasnella sp. JGI-2019a]
MSSQSTPNSSKPTTTASSSPSPVHMASFATLQSTYTATPTVYSSATQKSSSSMLKPLKKFFGSSNSSQSSVTVGTSETKAEKKERMLKGQEAKMTPEELKLAKLMQTYGNGSAHVMPGSSMGGKY